MLYALIGLYLVAGFIIARLIEEAYSEKDEGFKIPLILLIALVWLPLGGFNYLFGSFRAKTKKDGDKV
jgi:hypothetical protein